ncbi:hypothetical protein R1flu_009007 [Riccia fluitans]|uniref:Lipocalin/cytosolic fatty-acid binding domain-containing protein n=1 Tax=Riccia fluitans TaxID=41844 RepID=A0ABD1Z1P7_9MARC
MEGTVGTKCISQIGQRADEYSIHWMSMSFTRPLGKKEGEIKVENRDFLSARVGTIASVAGISGSSFSVCQSARVVCSQVNNGDSLLREGISKVWKLKGKIEDSYSSEASSISTAASKIESAANEISPKLDNLAKYVSQIQVANSVVSQTDGKADKSAVVEFVNSNISLATEQVKSVDSSYKVMSEAQLDLIKVAESLFKRGFDGVAVQNPKEGGKLKVSIGLSPDSNYWILAVNGESSSYNAALVYSCSEVLTGGIDETVWILSRTPELDDETMMSFINKASSLGIDLDCDAPFVKAVRTSNCPA